MLGTVPFGTTDTAPGPPIDTAADHNGNGPVRPAVRAALLGPRTEQGQGRTRTGTDPPQSAGTRGHSGHGRC
jgi:hypothetical protein